MKFSQLFILLFLSFYSLSASDAYSDLASKPLPRTCRSGSKALFEYKGDVYLLCYKQDQILFLNKVTKKSRKLRFEDADQSFKEFITSILIEANKNDEDFESKVYFGQDGKIFNENGEIGLFKRENKNNKNTVLIFAQDKSQKVFNVGEYFSCDRLTGLPQDKVFARCIAGVLGSVTVYANLVCTSQSCTDLTADYLNKNRSILRSGVLDNLAFIFGAITENSVIYPAYINLDSDIATKLTPHRKLRNQSLIEMTSDGKFLGVGSPRNNNSRKKYLIWKSQTTSPRLLLDVIKRYTDDLVRPDNSVQLLSSGYIGFIGNRSSVRSVIFVK